MNFQTYIKKFYLIIVSLLFLASCGLIGGDDKVEVSENAVLSGPPLAIPPEFDVNLDNPNQQQSQSVPNYEIEGFENDPIYESTQNENIFEDQTQENTFDDIETIQSFENYNPSNIETNNQPVDNNVVLRNQRTYRSTVPSDSYNFANKPLKTKRRVAQRKQDSTGFGNQSFEQLEANDPTALSQEEEYLLEDIFTNKESNRQIDTPDQDFDARGDSD